MLWPSDNNIHVWTHKTLIPQGLWNTFRITKPELKLGLTWTNYHGDFVLAGRFMILHLKGMKLGGGLDIFCCVLWLDVMTKLRQSETPLLQSLPMVIIKKLCGLLPCFQLWYPTPALAKRLFTLWSLTHAVHGKAHPHAVKMDSKNEDWMHPQPVRLTGLAQWETSF